MTAELLKSTFPGSDACKKEVLLLPNVLVCAVARVGSAKKAIEGLDSPVKMYNASYMLKNYIRCYEQNEHLFFVNCFRENGTFSPQHDARREESRSTSS